MKTGLKHELVKLLGSETVTTDYIECLLYSHDLAVLPKFITSMYKTIPDAVVRPQSAQQVSILQSFADNNSIPVIPRGNATTALGGTVPVLGGIVLDITSLNKVISLEPEKKLVTVEAGITCKELLGFLEKRGFTLYTYPTSAPAATIGGWLSAGGMGVGRAGIGIGSPRYGTAAEAVQDLEVVLPNGEIIDTALAKYTPRCFLGTDGILGIITKATLKVRSLPSAQKPISFTFANMYSLCEVVSQSANLPSFFTVFKDYHLLKAKKQAGINGVVEGNMVTFVLEGNKAHIDQDECRIRDLAIKQGGIDLGLQLANKEWEERFYPMRGKQTEPSLLGCEIVISLRQLNLAVKAIGLLAKKRGVTIGLQGIPVKQDVLLMAQVFCDERQAFTYILLLSLIRDLNELGFSLGGTPYGIGLFNAFFARKIHQDGFAYLESLKQELDPNKVMNPGKGLYHMNRFNIPVSKSAYDVAMNILGSLSWLR